MWAQGELVLAPQSAQIVSEVLRSCFRWFSLLALGVALHPPLRPIWRAHCLQVCGYRAAYSRAQDVFVSELWSSSLGFGLVAVLMLSQLHG